MDTERSAEAMPAAKAAKAKRKPATKKKAARAKKPAAPKFGREVTSALRTVAIETRALERLCGELENGLGAPFASAVETLSKTTGRVIVTGMGKSGHVGQKIAATFASTGTPAFFVHPSEASHGDLGMVTRDDVLLALSWSGETVELSNILTYARRFSVPLISITSSSMSALGRASDIVLQLPAVEEACPHGLAPTATTTMQLALGDSLAVALLEVRGFTAHDFKVFHPGGSLGAQLKLVEDIMHAGESLPLGPADLRMADALLVMTQKAFGCLGVVDDKGRLIGVVTDGDLRRHMGEDLLDATVGDIMTRNPKTIERKALTSSALDQLNSLRITSLFVVDDGKPVGIIHIHDLLRIGVA
jgi:arabinose-5-phosphate isomerase